MNFVKKLFLGSVVAMGAFGLVACGDDSSSGTDPNEPTKVEDPTQNDDIIDITGTGVIGAGQIKSFTGLVQLLFLDSSSTNSEELHYTSITGSILKVGDDGSYYATNVPIEMPPLSQNSGYDFAGTKLNLKDTSFTECGNFVLRVEVKATDNIKDFGKSVDIPFTRDELYCPVISSSASSSDPIAEQSPAMQFCQVTISTESYPGVNLAECKSVVLAESATADLIFSAYGKRDESDISVSSGTGLKFTVNTNDTYEVGFWPEQAQRTPAGAFVNDFQFKAPTNESLQDLLVTQTQIYIAATANYSTATGAGIYPFGIVEKTPEDNGQYTITIKIYKVQ